MTTPALEEIKVRARIARNTAVRAGAADAPRLGDCLRVAARAVGFRDWDHARHVLGGLAVPGDDMGAFWHAPRCSALLNEWFADPAAAQAAHARGRGFLLPYRRQFVVVQPEFIRELGMDPDDGHWTPIRRNAVDGYGSGAWQSLCLSRLRAPGARFG